MAATLSAYVGVFWNGFVDFDDNVYVTNNPYTAAGLSLSGIRYALTTFDSGNWIPLTWISYQLDVTLFGMSPVGFHATNLALHCANGLLLFTWLVRVTAARWRSLVLAAIFALHPLHVESVAWIAERKDVLSTFWLLLTLHAYTTYAMQPRFTWYMATIATFALGLLSKSMLVTLPLLLLIIDFWPLNRWRASAVQDELTSVGPRMSFIRLSFEKVPLLALSILMGVVTIVAAASAKAFAQVTLITRLGNALQSGCWYILKTFAPTNLCVLYPHPMNELSWGAVVASGAVLLLTSLYIGINGFRRPHLIFGWLWFLIALAPVIGILHVGSQSHADRYSYVPHIGLLVLIVWEGQFWLKYLGAPRRVTVGLVALATAGCAWLTVHQVSVWQSTETLWQHAIDVDPDNWYAHGALGILCLDSDRIDDAARHFQRVSQLQPAERESLSRLIAIYRRYPGKLRTSAGFYNDLGRYRVNESDMVSAADLFAKAVQVAPDNISARNNLALALSHLGKDREAQLNLETVLSQRPNDVNARVNLGVLLEKTGQMTAARVQFITALRLDPTDEEARNRLREIEKRLESQPASF